MSTQPESPSYIRNITPWERLLNLSPFSVVTMVVRLKGSISEKELLPAVSKLQSQHILLQTKITWDNQGNPCFTSKDVEEIPIKVIARTSVSQWQDVYREECLIPFDFTRRPPIRFILLQSPEICEILIFCHHVICDGKSLAFLARDLMEYLGNPSKLVPPVSIPAPLSLSNIPSEVALGGFMQKIMAKINTKWELERIQFDYEDYLALHHAYWKTFTHEMMTLELDQLQTKHFVDICHREKVTVNSALAVAFLAAQISVVGKLEAQSKIGIGADLRSRMTEQVGESMGFYAGVVNVKFKYNRRKSFWDNARAFHKKVSPKYTNKTLFSDPVQFLYLNPEIMESSNFKTIGSFVSPESDRYDKLTNFASRQDMVLSLLKRSNADSVDKKIMGTALTNLTRMDFPTKYGALKLDRLIMQPGGAFALTKVNLAIGVVTCAEKMSILVQYAKRTLNNTDANQIKLKVLEILQLD